MKVVTWSVVCVAVVIGVGCGTGCQRGVAPLWSQANPQTSIKVDPLSKRFEVFSNDGKTLSADRIEARWGDNSLLVEKLNVEDRSVENRLANVEQMKLGAEITRVAISEMMSGLAGMIREGLLPMRGATAHVETPIGTGDVQLGNGAQTPAPSPSVTPKAKDPPEPPPPEPAEPPASPVTPASSEQAVTIPPERVDE